MLLIITDYNIQKNQYIIDSITIDLFKKLKLEKYLLSASISFLLEKLLFHYLFLPSMQNLLFYR